MNSLYQQLNQNQQIPTRNNSLQQLINNFKQSSNPQQFIKNLIQQGNPQFQSIYLALQNSNKSPKDFFYEVAKQKGIN